MTATFTSPSVDIIIPAKVNTAFTQMKTDIETLQTGSNIATSTVGAGATKTLDATHNNMVVFLDTAGGSVVTLPSATGSGVSYKFLVSVIATSNSHVVKVGRAADTMIGVLFSRNSVAGAVTGWPAVAATSDTVTLNRTTTGSVNPGECIDMIDIAANVWSVSGWLTNSGTAATPFGNTVS